MPLVRTLEPSRERWEFEANCHSDMPGHRAVSAVDLTSQSIHGAFAHVVTSMENPIYAERAMTQRANLIVNAPELLELADRFFSFYELHKSARGGALGVQYQELRAKIMGEVPR